MTKSIDINVLVTGFGAYPNSAGGHIDPNMSYVLTTILPTTLAPNTAQNPSPSRVNILTLPSPIKAEYAYVRKFVQDLHREHAEDVDLFVHLGEARGWTFATLERVAYKQGMSSSWWGHSEKQEYYNIADNAGLTIEDAGPCPWDDVPMGLQSALNIDTVADGATAILRTRSRFGTGEVSKDEPSRPGSDSPIDIKPHSEGGPYLCGFIHYESLANCYVNKRKPNVLFCHIPGDEDEKSLNRARDAILAIIVSAVNEIRNRQSR